MEYSKRVKSLVKVLVLAVVVGVVLGSAVTAVYLNHQSNKKLVEMAEKYKSNLEEYNDLLDDYLEVREQYDVLYSDLRHTQMLQLFEDGGFTPKAP